MLERLLELKEHIRKAGRVERSDLPKDMLILEECINLHPAEYAVNYVLMERKLKQLECYIDRANSLLDEVRDSGDYGSRIDDKITAFLREDSIQLRKEQEK